MINEKRNTMGYARKIQEESIIVDAHFDLLYDVVRKRAKGLTKVIEKEYLPELSGGGVNIIVASIYIDDMFLPEMALRRALNQISALYSEIDESGDKIMLCRTYTDIMEALERGRLAILLSFEGVEPIYNDLSLLKVFYELGVRLIGLTWSRRNFAGDGCSFNKVREGQKGGLTKFGVDLVEEAERIGMIIDVSHLNDEGFWDVMKIVKRPVIASHSNARSLVGSMRNLNDDQIKTLASKTGVMGMNGCNTFVAEDYMNAGVKELVDHVDYIKNLVGIEFVGTGFDFCDKIFQSSSLTGTSRKAFDVIKGHKKIDEFIYELLNRGYGEEDIKLIMGGNFLRVFKEVL